MLSPAENLNGSILGKDILCYAARILYYPFLIMILGPYICCFEEVDFEIRRVKGTLRGLTLALLRV
jgi:hypothetical protein